MIIIKNGNLIKFENSIKRIKDIKLVIEDIKNPNVAMELSFDEMLIIENSLEWLFKKIKIKYNNFKQAIRYFVESLYYE